MHLPQALAESFFDLSGRQHLAAEGTRTPSPGRSLGHTRRTVGFFRVISALGVEKPSISAFSRPRPGSQHPNLWRPWPACWHQSGIRQVLHGGLPAGAGRHRLSGQPSRMRSQSPWGPRSLPIAGFGPSPASACGGNLGSGNGLGGGRDGGSTARQHVIVDLSYPPADGAAPCWAVDCAGPTGGDSRPLQVENEGEELNQRQNQSPSGSPFRMPVPVVVCSGKS